MVLIYSFVFDCILFYLDWLIAFRVFPYCSDKSECYCFRCLTSIRSFVIKVLVFWKCFRSRESVPTWNGLSLEGEIVRYPSVSLSPTLSMNEKVEQHIRKKTHKPNSLRFWVEGGVISLCGLTQFSFLFISQRFLLSNSPCLSPQDFSPRILLVCLPKISPFEFSKQYIIIYCLTFF